MRLKHWAYVSIALIEVNAVFLGGVRAADLPVEIPAVAQPGFSLFHFHLSDLWAPSPKSISRPVNVRLFSEANLDHLWLKNSAGFKVSGHKVRGTVFITVLEGKVQASSDGKRLDYAKEVKSLALDGETYEIQVREKLHKWTRGELRCRVVKGHLQIVNKLGIEDYAAGVLEGELGTVHLSPEVLQAQIIVVRSYVLAMRWGRHSGEGFELCDRPHCQVFRGVPHDTDAEFQVALAKVRGEYLSYRGRPIAAFYHHSCGGMTSAIQDVWPAPAKAYLKAVAEPDDSYCKTSPKVRWRATLSKRKLRGSFLRFGWIKPGESVVGLEIIKKDQAGRVQQILIETGKSGKHPIGRLVKGGKFVNNINQYFGGDLMKSTLFTISDTGNSYVLHGRGWGHGVGFCQEGAMWMARHGKTYKEILKHYFPHSKISRLS